MITNLTKAKAQLVIDQPFFASLLLGMPMEEEKRIKTIATNGEKIFYNPEFMDTLTLPETVFVLAHEVMHCVFLHFLRKGSRNHNKWNIAGDYIINNVLHQEKVGIMPSMALHNPNLVTQGKETTEGVYDLLPDSAEQNSPGEPGGSLDDCMDGTTGDAAETASKEAEMRVKVVQAQNAAKMHGKLSAGLERLVKSWVQPSVDWRFVLRRFITERAKTDLSYARPKRRWLGEDICLPSLSGEQIGAIVIPVDCSGSVSPDILNKFASEIKGIIEDVSPRMVHVIYFDSEVLRQDDFTPEETFEVHAIGGGGTAFSPIFKQIEDKGLEPVCCVVLTDLQCSDFGNAPNYPVLWATTDATAAPWGEVIKLK